MLSFATVNQEKLMKLIKDINTDDELINSPSQIQEILEQIQQARLDEAQSHINPEEVKKNKQGDK
jgi:TfoX/Sxy family transcriptional regulator of competence genes